MGPADLRAPLIHAPGPNPWAFGSRPAYLVAPWPAYAADEAEAMVELARRYLRAYGPATAADLAQFSTLYRPRAKDAFEALGDEVVRHDGPDRRPVFDLAESAPADEDHQAPPRLLGCGTTCCSRTPARPA